MKLDFDDVKETVRTIALRLDSPASNYSFLFSESDDVVEVRVEVSGSMDPLFIFIVDAERFRVIKAVDINPEGYASFPYHSYIELLSFIIEHFYPVFLKLTNGGSITDMLSMVFGEKVRIWKDLLRIICKSADVEYKDRGVVFSFLDTNFVYNSNLCKLILSGEVEEECKVNSVMELVITLFTVVGYIFQLHDLDANPILGTQLAEEVDPLAEDEMALEEDIDNMDMGDVFDEGGDMAIGEDLSAEFEPAGDSIDTTAPDLDSGKEQVLDEIQTSYKPLFYGGQLIASGGGAWFSTKNGYFHIDEDVSSHENFVNGNRSLFNVPDTVTEDDLVPYALKMGWVRVRGRGTSVNLEVCAGSRCVPNLVAISYYLVYELGENVQSQVDGDIVNPRGDVLYSFKCSLQDIMNETIVIPSYLSQGYSQERFECEDVGEIQTSYRPLYSGKHAVIFSMAQQVLSSLNKSRASWLLGFTKKLLSRFPGGYYGFSSDDKAWQVFDANKNLLISVGVSMDNGDYLFVYNTSSGRKSGRVSELKSLLELLPVIGV